MALCLIETKKVVVLFLGLNQSLAQLGIHQYFRAIHKNYSTLDARLRSFALWPVSLKQKPDVLSEAGFYYTGKIVQDAVMCDRDQFETKR